MFGEVAISPREKQETLLWERAISVQRGHGLASSRSARGRGLVLISQGHVPSLLLFVFKKNRKGHF
jgi:hypothetical protein